MKVPAVSRMNGSTLIAPSAWSRIVAEVAVMPPPALRLAAGPGPGTGARPPPRTPSPGRPAAGRTPRARLQLLGHGQGDQQRPAGGDGQQRRPVRIAEERHRGPGIDRHRQRGHPPRRHYAASFDGAGAGAGRAAALRPVARSEYAIRFLSLT